MRTTLYSMAGGSAAIRRMTRCFYAKAVADPLLHELFDGKDDHAEHIAGYFIYNFGGPADYLYEHGDVRFVVQQHAGMNITDEQRARWAEHMYASAIEVGMPRQFTDKFARYLDFASRETQRFSNLEPQEATAQLGEY